MPVCSSGIQKQTKRTWHIMVRVFKCHSFASQRVIQLEKEPLTICADGDRVFVATSECEIIVFHVSGDSCNEVRRFPTISQVERVVFNCFKNYLLTIELKKAWKKITKSVRVYLNWDTGDQEKGRPRTKVRVAGRSHVQHISTSNLPSTSDSMEIVEVPVDGNASCVAVCNYTGNFAVACGLEVKLCSVVEKTVANSEKTYLDVEIFLELCWNFQVISISLCEEFVVCCSPKEVQAIRVRYEEGEKGASRAPRKLGKSASVSSSSAPDSHTLASSLTSPPSSYVSDSFLYTPNQTRDSSRPTSSVAEQEIEVIELVPLPSSTRDFSTVGMKPQGRQTPKTGTASSPFLSSSSASLTSSLSFQETRIVNDENFVEWSFRHGGSSSSAGNDAVCLPGLHTRSTQSQCRNHAHVISPPVLSDFSTGKVKSCLGVQAETVLHLSDVREQEDWTCIILIPTHNGGLSSPIRISSNRTDRMRSASSGHTRTSMCCYVSGTSGGYLYSLTPSIHQVSSYKYTSTATQVGISQSHLHVVTKTGIETYTSRWGAVSLEIEETLTEDSSVLASVHPPSSLDICLCGHEPFLGGINLSVGTDFLALLSKVEDLTEVVEAHWGLYVLHSFSLVDLYKDMIEFTLNIRGTAPSSYLHLLQEAHLLLASHPLTVVVQDVHVRECLQDVSRLLGEFYSQPEENSWSLCWPYYHLSGTSVQDIVKNGLRMSEKYSPRKFGRGLVDFLDHTLFSQEEYINLSEDTCDTILNIYAVAAPEKLSRVMLLSNIRAFSADTALHHLKTWLSVKASSGKKPSAVDRLALVQLHLKLCEVEVARIELESVGKWPLVEVCCSYPALLHDGLSAFTPLAQLMRQHMSGTLLEVLVEMVDRGIMSLDRLLTLLKNQTLSDVPYSGHVREVLELIVSSDKRAFLYEEATHMLSEAYLSQIDDKDQPSPKQLFAVAHQKFQLPPPEGHFARRYAWLDHLPPFQGPQSMTKPCQLLDFKRLGARGSSLSVPITMASNRHGQREKCSCCVCNQSLLKLQSLLCSPRLSAELADFVLKRVGVPQGQFHDERDEGEVEGQAQHDSKPVKAGDSEALDSVRLLCLCKLDLEKATELIVDRYPAVVGCFSSCCYKGSVDKYTHLLRGMETVMKSFAATPDKTREETYVKAYKDLLQRMSEIFSPGKFLDLLPTDGNLYFLLPFLLASFEKEHTSSVKRKIVDMGKGLLSET